MGGGYEMWLRMWIRCGEEMAVGCSGGRGMDVLEDVSDAGGRYEYVAGRV